MADPFAPSAPEPVDPDTALADLEADFQAVTSPPEIVVVQEQPPPIGRSWSFDFPRQRFRDAFGAHAPLTTNGVATLVQWAEKCLQTTRGAHPIHPPGYGLRDRTALIGHTVNGAPVAELESRIREALTFHPRIADIDDFAYDFDTVADEYIAVSFTLVLDDDTRLPANVSLTLTSTQEF
jgi:hypothetical protein